MRPAYCVTAVRQCVRSSIDFIQSPNLEVTDDVVHVQIDASYDKSVETDAKNWIEDVLGEKVAWGSDEGGPGSGFADGLKSGEVLCRYVWLLAYF